MGWVEPGVVKPAWLPAEMSVKLHFEYISTEIFPTQLSTAAVVKPADSAIIQAVQILVQSVFRYNRLSDSGVSGKLALCPVEL